MRSSGSSRRNLPPVSGSSQPSSSRAAASAQQQAFDQAKYAQMQQQAPLSPNDFGYFGSGDGAFPPPPAEPHGNTAYGNTLSSNYNVERRAPITMQDVQFSGGSQDLEPYAGGMGELSQDAEIVPYMGSPSRVFDDMEITQGDDGFFDFLSPENQTTDLAEFWEIDDPSVSGVLSEGVFSHEGATSYGLPSDSGVHRFGEEETGQSSGYNRFNTNDDDADFTDVSIKSKKSILKLLEGMTSKSEFLRFAKHIRESEAIQLKMDFISALKEYEYKSKFADQDGQVNEEIDVIVNNIKKYVDFIELLKGELFIRAKNYLHSMGSKQIADTLKKSKDIDDTIRLNFIIFMKDSSINRQKTFYYALTKHDGDVFAKSTNADFQEKMQKTLNEIYKNISEFDPVIKGKVAKEAEAKRKADEKRELRQQKKEAEAAEAAEAAKAAEAAEVVRREKAVLQSYEMVQNILKSVEEVGLNKSQKLLRGIMPEGINLLLWWGKVNIALSAVRLKGSKPIAEAFVASQTAPAQHRVALLENIASTANYYRLIVQRAFKENSNARYFASLKAEDENYRAQINAALDTIMDGSEERARYFTAGYVYQPQNVVIAESSTQASLDKGKGRA